MRCSEQKQNARSKEKYDRNQAKWVELRYSWLIHCTNPKNFKEYNDALLFVKIIIYTK